MADLKRRERGKVVNFGVCDEIESNNDEFREQGQCSSSSPTYYLDKFTLYKNSSYFYMTGRDVNEKHWRVLKIGRSQPSELNINEDPKTYSRETCKALLYSIQGLQCVVDDCYGIVGFIKLLQTYNILLITKRKEVGKICGHAIYSISEYKMIPISHSNRWDYFTKEARYRKLLQLVDIRDNFFFSWAYPLMHRLQLNLSKQKTEHSSDRTMFIWNEKLTHQTRASLGNTLWTVALIHGFFKQIELSTGGNKFMFTLIARRSCQFAGTRYEKRGVNNNGQAANDVEVEQIVWQHIHNECSSEISSAVQVRGSIPLSWSQNSAVLKFKPDIQFSKGNYKATQLHFESLRLRYGVPQIILNLLKTTQNKHREFILHNEFQNAVDFINQGLAEEDRVEFLSLDLDAAFKNLKTDELKELKGKSAPALKKTGIFSCKMPQSVNFKASFDLSYSRIDSDSADSLVDSSSNSNDSFQHQKGILRSNCLDSLDRTNVAQYVYGMVALGLQLNTLKLIESQELKFSDPLAYDLMNIYQAMGDALSRQYAGSPAHHKIFAKIRGKNKVTTHFQEFMKSIQRHYSNSFTDGTKQQAIDLFLGHLQPDDALINPSKRELDQRDICEWIKAIHLKNISRCNGWIYSGFERLWYDSDAEKSGKRALPGPSGSSQHGSQQGHSMVDFSAGP